MLLPKRVSPGRWPPYSSFNTSPTGMYTRPRSGSAGVGRPRVVLADAVGADLGAGGPRCSRRILLAAESGRTSRGCNLPGVHIEAANEAGDVVQVERVVAMSPRSCRPRLHHLPTTIAGELAAISPLLGSIPIVPSAPIFFTGSHFSPGFALRSGIAFADHQRPGVVHCKRHQWIAETEFEIDHAVRAELGIALAGLRVDRGEVITRRDDDRAFIDTIGQTTPDRVRQTRAAPSASGVLRPSSSATASCRYPDQSQTHRDVSSRP